VSGVLKIAERLAGCLEKQVVMLNRARAYQRIAQGELTLQDLPVLADRASSVLVESLSMPPTRALLMGAIRVVLVTCLAPFYVAMATQADYNPGGYSHL